MDQAAKDNQTLIAFWDQAQTIREEDRADESDLKDDAWKELAPAEKLFLAAGSLGGRKKVLDYGCGSAWAGIIAAKSGCADVTAVDPAPGAVDAARYYASLFGAADRMNIRCVPPEWLQTVPESAYDGVICSNVLDVIPPETAAEIIRELARIAARDASVIVSLNFFLSPDAAAQRGIALENGCKLYQDGVLRLVSRTDAEWTALLSQYFSVEKLEHFAWPGEKAETRRLFYLKKR